MHMNITHGPERTMVDTQICDRALMSWPRLDDFPREVVYIIYVLRWRSAHEHRSDRSIDASLIVPVLKPTQRCFNTPSTQVIAPEATRSVL